MINVLYYEPEQASENIYHIYLWHTKCSNLAEVRWPIWHMMYVMYTKVVYKFFPTGGMGGVPPHSNSQNFAHFPFVHQIFSCIHCSSTIFVLISYSFKTHIMLILILLDVKYSQNTVFTFENFLNRPNHFSSGSRHLIKNPLRSVHYFLTQSQGES